MIKTTYIILHYFLFLRKDPHAASAATRVQASQVRWRLLLAAKASRRLGCSEFREMETLAKLRALIERNVRKTYERERHRDV